MSPSIATVPRSAGNGTALVVVAADMLIRLFASNKPKVVPAAKAAVKAAAQPVAVQRAVAAQPDVWQLYRLSTGSDSVRPALAAKLRNEFTA